MLWSARLRRYCWQDFALEQGALGVVLAQFLFLYAVDGGALGARAAGEDPEPRTTPSGLMPLTRSVFAQFRGRADLVAWSALVATAMLFGPANTEFLEEM